MDSEQHSTRAEAARNAKDLSDRADMRQHAHKLIRGFEKLDDSAARKAVWELIQNACDLTEDCRIAIDFQNDTFGFTHNGQPFTTHTLLSLIKQVSGKGGAAEQAEQTENRNLIGQFGTGFITTHSFGRVITLDSTLDVGLPGERGPHVALQNFVIDRSARDIEQLVDELVLQHKRVYQLVETADLLPAAGTNTTFRYEAASDTEKRKVELAHESLRLYTPLVMALNESLKSVTVEANNGQTEQYEKGEWREENGIWQIPISCNGTTSLIQCLRSDDESVQVVLPLNNKGEAVTPATQLARLFLYFPLVGSEVWGCDFIVHSPRFAPTEPRDGLHLELDNEQTKPLAEQNRQVLLEASELIFAFVERSAEQITDPVRLARVHFGSWPIDAAAAEQNFRSALQKLWVEKFRKLPLVETSLGRKSASECWFLSPELLRGEDAAEAMHTIVSQLWQNQVPIATKVADWTNVVSEWQDETTQWVTAERLATKLAEHASLTGLNAVALRAVYDYLLAQGQAKLFDSHQLLPAGGGTFKLRGEVKKPLNLAPQHMAVLSCILPDVVAGFVQPAFENLELALDSYGRSQLGRDVNEQTRKVLEGNASELTDDVRKGLRILNSIYPAALSPTVAASTRRKVMPSIFQFYEQDYEECIVANDTDDEIEYEKTPFRTLLRVFLGDFEYKFKTEKEWAAADALPLLKKCLEVLAPSKEAQEVLIGTAVFPNQNSQLRQPGSLLIEKEFVPVGGNPEVDAERLKTWHREVLSTEIQETLVHHDFETSLSYFKPSEQSGKDLASKMEGEMAEMRPLEDITNHEKQSTILNIIKQISAISGWGAYFPRINGSKASIMLAKISDEKVKDNLFGIIGLEHDQIAQLGELARDENFEEIIARGRAAIAEKQASDYDMQFKKEIGVGIEDLIRQRLKNAVQGLSVMVLERQGGQDMVVEVDGKVVYRIEVKARWRTSYSITLSHLQSLVAAQHPERYALCSVDLTSYYPEGGEDKRHHVTDIQNIEHLIQFVPDIGVQVDALIAEVREAENKDDAVKLAEEIRVIVPQKVVQRGISLSDFIDHLVGVLTPATPVLLEE